MGSIHTSKRRQVAREAAQLLYTGQEKEFKQAKLRAVKILGIRALPSNFEVAVQLDIIAQEREGKFRKKEIVQMRQEALQIMLLLGEFHPRLVGSVWRGTSRHNSDIDVIAYAGNSQEVTSVLQKNNYQITNVNNQTITRKGAKKSFLHIYVKLQSNRQAEIVIHGLEDMDKQERCEVYGDNKTGLTALQLQQVLREDPEKRFTPKT